MAETKEELEAFRAEARAWLKESFPSSLAGRAAELMGSEVLDASAAHGWPQFLALYKDLELLRDLSNAW